MSFSDRDIDPRRLNESLLGTRIEVYENKGVAPVDIIVVSGINQRKGEVSGYSVSPHPQTQVFRYCCLLEVWRYLHEDVMSDEPVVSKHLAYDLRLAVNQ